MKTVYSLLTALFCKVITPPIALQQETPQPIQHNTQQRFEEIRTSVYRTDSGNNAKLSLEKIQKLQPFTVEEAACAVHVTLIPGLEYLAEPLLDLLKNELNFNVHYNKLLILELVLHKHFYNTDVQERLLARQIYTMIIKKYKSGIDVNALTLKGTPLWMKAVSIFINEEDQSTQNSRECTNFLGQFLHDFKYTIEIEPFFEKNNSKYSSWELYQPQETDSSSRRQKKQDLLQMIAVCPRKPKLRVPQQKKIENCHFLFVKHTGLE